MGIRFAHVSVLRVISNLPIEQYQGLEKISVSILLTLCLWEISPIWLTAGV